MSCKKVMMTQKILESLNPYYNGKYSMRGKNILN